VGEDGANLELLPVVVKCGNQPGFVAANVEDGELAHEVSGREGVRLDAL